MLVTGKGLWIWYGSRLGDPAAAARQAADAGLRWVCLKSADGAVRWERDFSPALVQAFRQAGVRVFSWQYVYGANPSGEAAAARWSLEAGSELHVLDVEAEFEGQPQRLAALLAACADLAPWQLGYSSFGIQQYHGVDWPQFRGRSGTAWPQIYWGEFGYTPERAVELAAAGLTGFDGQVVPLGDTYGPVDGASTLRFAQACRAHWPGAVGWYSWDATRPDVWQAIAAAVVDAAPPTGPRPLEGVELRPDGSWVVSRPWRDRLVSLLGEIGQASYADPPAAGLIQRDVRRAKTMLLADDFDS